MAEADYKRGRDHGEDLICHRLSLRSPSGKIFGQPLLDGFGDTPGGYAEADHLSNECGKSGDMT